MGDTNPPPQRYEPATTSDTDEALRQAMENPPQGHVASMASTQYGEPAGPTRGGSPRETEITQPGYAMIPKETFTTFKLQQEQLTHCEFVIIQTSNQMTDPSKLKDSILAQLTALLAPYCTGLDLEIISLGFRRRGEKLYYLSLAPESITSFFWKHITIFTIFNNGTYYKLALREHVEEISTGPRKEQTECWFFVFAPVENKHSELTIQAATTQALDKIGFRHLLHHWLNKSQGAGQRRYHSSFSYSVHHEQLRSDLLRELKDWPTDPAFPDQRMSIWFQPKWFQGEFGHTNCGQCYCLKPCHKKCGDPGSHSAARGDGKTKEQRASDNTAARKRKMDAANESNAKGAAAGMPEGW